MRTPNTKCSICDKPLYRRPYEFKKWKAFCCKSCRSELYQNREPSPNLLLGRCVKGENHLRGIPKSEASKKKRSISHKIYWANHPEEAKARGAKTRGANHYHWKGGSTQLNQAIRRLTENRKWMDAVRERDKECQHCSSIENLESHHIIPVAMLIEKYNIQSADDARLCKELWDIKNGIALCQKCHYKLDGRTYED